MYYLRLRHRNGIVGPYFKGIREIRHDMIGKPASHINILLTTPVFEQCAVGPTNLEDARVWRDEINMKCGTQDVHIELISGTGKIIDGIDQFAIIIDELADI